VNGYCPLSSRIYLPGEKEWERYEKASKSGMVLPYHMKASLLGAAEDYHLDIERFIPF
jgi:LDH2 family malate/lactate/ureidoglycolate dehydrogenase